MNETIKALKENERPFGLMSEEMQETIKKPKYSNDREWICEEGKWRKCYHSPLLDFYTYRLRSDYTEPEAGVEKCEVGRKDGIFQFERMAGSDYWYGIHAAVNMPNFIGYLYEDGIFSVLPRRFRREINIDDIRPSFSDIENYEVLTPTHVLFRSK